MLITGPMAFLVIALTSSSPHLVSIKFNRSMSKLSKMCTFIHHTLLVSIALNNAFLALLSSLRSSHFRCFFNLNMCYMLSHCFFLSCFAHCRVIYHLSLCCYHLPVNLSNYRAAFANDYQPLLKVCFLKCQSRISSTTDSILRFLSLF